MSIIKPNFNDPNFDPKNFRAIERKVQKGLTHEEQARLVAAALKMTGYKEEHLPDVERLLIRFKGVMSEVWQKYEQEDAMVRAAGKEWDHIKLMSSIQADFFERLGHYEKDELLVCLCTVLAQSVKIQLV